MLTGALSNQVQTSYMEIVKQVREVTEVSMNEIERKIKSGSSDTKLWSALEFNGYKDAIDQYNDIGYINSYLNSLYINESTYEGAGIVTKFGSYGNIFSKELNESVFFDTPFYRNVREAKGSVIWEGTNENIFANKGKVITVARLEMNGANGQELGVSIINLKTEFFRNKLSKVSIAEESNIKLFIVNSDMREITGIGDDQFEGGSLVGSESMMNSIRQIKNNGADDGFFYYDDNIVFFDTISLTGWIIIATVPNKIIMEPVYKVRMQVLWIALVSIIISFMLALSMSKNVTEPIKKMIDVMKKAERGDLSAKCNVYGNNEMSFMGESFNKMMDEVKKSRDDLEMLNKDLEKHIEDRTQQLKKAYEEVVHLNLQLNEYAHDQEEKNAELEQALETVKETQKQLIQSEKMAGLGSMVAGVAHEINTPVGVSVTAVTYLLEKTKEIVEAYKNKQLKKSVLEKYLNIALESASATYSNLFKASELIKSFKRVSVDTSNEEKNIFNVYEYLNNIVLALSPEFKGKNYNIIINCDPKIDIYSYPGSYSQIFTNLIMNSIIHGFERKPEGRVTIDVNKNSKNIVFVYKDNGKGIPDDILNKVFDPFFTTKRSEGGTGLGLNIVYNIVTQNLGGSITVRNESGNGAVFIIEIPVKE